MFRDKCDGCHTFKICKGYKGMILCDECIKKIGTVKNENEKDLGKAKKNIIKNTTIFDFI